MSGRLVNLSAKSSAVTGAQEDAHERFRRLARKRAVRTMKDLRLIGNLGNRNNYAYTTGEVDKLFRTLEKELNAARAKFDVRKKDADVDFSF